jgi:hypothetical protein
LIVDHIIPVLVQAISNAHLVGAIWARNWPIVTRICQISQSRHNRIRIESGDTHENNHSNYQAVQA